MPEFFLAAMRDTTSGMDNVSIKINRTIIGLASIACLAVAGYVWYQAADESQQPGWLGPLVRLGVTIGAIWIASAKWFGIRGSIELSPKALLAVVAVLAAIAIRPRIGLAAVIVIAVLWFVVRPRRPRETIDRRKNPKP